MYNAPQNVDPNLRPITAYTYCFDKCFSAQLDHAFLSEFHWYFTGTCSPGEFGVIPSNLLHAPSPIHHIAFVNFVYDVSYVGEVRRPLT